MTSRAKKFVIILAIALLAVMVLSACDETPTLDGEKEAYNLTAYISYHANGGICGDQSKVATLYYQDGDMPLEYGSSKFTGNLVIKKEGYDLGGWYYPEKDSEGNVVYEDEKNDIVKLSDNKYDFSVAMKSGDEIDVYAKWIKQKNVKVLLASDPRMGDGGITQDEKHYDVNDVIKEYSFNKDDRVEKPQNDPVTDSKYSAPIGFTFVGFYADAACTRSVEWPIRRTDEEGDVYIYARYFTSDWTVVENSSDVVRMFSNSNNTGKYYVKNDIVAASNAQITIYPNATFSGVIEGNGYTLEGFTFSATNLKEKNQVSLLGIIQDGAIISDLTIKNFNGIVRAKNCTIEAYFLMLAVNDGAEISGLKLDGGSMTVKGEGVAWKNALGDECPLYMSGHDGIEIINSPTKD